MSKFDSIVINGGNNQFGDHNTQHNVTNNHHHHTHNTGGEDSNGGDALSIGIGVLAGFAALTWLFFAHINQVYFYLNLASLSSGVLSIFAIGILVLTREVERMDVCRLLGSILLAVGLFGLSVLSREHANEDIISLSQNTKFMDFWRSLTDYGKDLVISNFVSAIAIGFAVFIAHLAALRQFSYALADSNGTGFWFNLYTRMNRFKMRVSYAVISVLAGLVWAALAGKLSSFYH
ncbi:hypothetical protein Q9891_003345 [Vibrio cholerae]|nr:hypothetical protein [Vibrio cholerae]